MEADINKPIDSRQTAAPAFAGFTLLEVLVVVLIIGILATLGYASLTDLIFTNRAKESAHTIRTFTEKIITDAKRQDTSVVIALAGNNMTASIGGAVVKSEALSRGFNNGNATGLPAPYNVASNNFNGGETVIVRRGLSGVTREGYFAACGARGYCAAAVKITGENSFRAHIRRGTNASWEAL
jgi:prepilin-type N-terminal cleavage/methylation domain-containing protein